MVTKIISFGARHQEGAPKASATVMVLDIRKQFRNPYHDRKLRKLRGTDPVVQADIRKTPGFWSKFDDLKVHIQESDVDIVYIGCTGGHHRSVYLAELLGAELQVPVEHRDYDKP